MIRNDYAAVIYSDTNKEQLEHAKNIANNKGVFNIKFFKTLKKG